MDKNTAQTGESTENAGSSTASGLVELLDSKLGRLFAAAKSETFESGFESGFSAELKSLVHRYGDDAIISLANFIILINKSTSPVVAAEALRAIGEIEDSLSYDARRSLLERSLRSSSPVIRDAAALGIASLDDPHALEFLYTALEKEQNRLVRKSLEQVVRQLEQGRESGTATA